MTAQTTEKKNTFPGIEPGDGAGHFQLGQPKTHAVLDMLWHGPFRPMSREGAMLVRAFEKRKRGPKSTGKVSMAKEKDYLGGGSE